ncbi:MAG: hypothetical protein IPL49_20955 [Saprospirales bacterium]|nr:hypothetical protein [Saprospirales bacterium]
MKRIILLSILGLLAMQVDAQSYITAIGARVGTDWGLTLQQRLTKRLTIEGIAESSFSRDETMLTGLVETHLPLITRHFNIYGGAGIHKGWSTNQREFVEDPYGVSFIGGAELTLGRFNLSYDFKPALNVVGGARKFYTTQAFSLRFVLIKDNIFYKGNKKNNKCCGKGNRW